MSKIHSYPLRQAVGLLGLTFLTAFAHAQNPRIDPGFLPTEVCRPAEVYSAQVQADGKVVLLSDASRLGSQPGSPITRLLAGSLQPDVAFNQNTEAATGPYSKSVQLPSGKLLLTGVGYISSGGVQRVSMLRLNADGTPDPGFTPDPALFSLFAGDDGDVLVQPDGKIIITGNGVYVPGGTPGYVLRLNPDGDLDPTFQAALGAVPNQRGKCLALQADGKVLVGGAFTSIGGQPRFKIARLLPSGALDLGFVPPTTFSSEVEQLAVQPADGKVLVLRRDGTLTRLLPTGTLDPTFQTGTNFSAPLLSQGAANNVLRLQPDGSLLVGTTATRYNGAPIGRLVRLQATGQLDPTFANTTASLDERPPLDLTVLPNGQLLLTASNGLRLSPTSGLPVSIARLQADGSRDAGFTLNLLKPGIVYDVVREPTGALLIGGDFTEVNGTGVGYLARLQATGAVDATFAAAARPDYLVRTLARQPDGRLLVGGDFTTLAGTDRMGLGQLLPSGAIDAAFAPPSQRIRGGRAQFTQAVVQPDGQVLLLGYFNLRAAPNSGQSFGRVNGLTGQPDRSFRPVDSTGVRRLLVQPDGRIVAAGGGPRLAPNGPVAVWRMLPSGALDPSFTLTELAVVPGAANIGTALARDPGTGALYVGGAFAGLNSSTVSYLARLSATGIPDASYQPTFSGRVGTTVNDLALQPNGRLLVGGGYGLGNQSFGTARFLATGLPDVSYTNTSGPSAEVYRLLVLPNETVVAVGNFQQVSGLPIVGLTQLIASNVLSALSTLAPPKTEVWPVPARTVLHVALDTKAEPQQVALLDLLGRVVATQSVTTSQMELNVASLPAAAYILRVQYKNGLIVKRIIVQ